MTVGDILRLRTGRMTRQEIADMALSEDRARRLAKQRGDKAEARRHDREVRKLAKQMSAR